VIVMMAALNVAGYDYESGNRPLSALRRQVREDLKQTNPALVEKLKAYFQAHRGTKSDAAAVAPYLTLALSITDAPAFTIDVPQERLPDEVRDIPRFCPPAAGVFIRRFRSRGLGPNMLAHTPTLRTPMGRRRSTLSRP
jgi:hypothetical protein